jgi:hypothetical protein
MSLKMEILMTTQPDPELAAKGVESSCYILAEKRILSRISHRSHLMFAIVCMYI